MKGMKDKMKKQMKMAENSVHNNFFTASTNNSLRQYGF